MHSSHRSLLGNLGLIAYVKRIFNECVRGGGGGGATESLGDGIDRRRGGVDLRTMESQNIVSS